MKDDFDPRDRRPLPPNFGKRDNVLQFTKRPEGLSAAKAIPTGGGEDNPLAMLKWMVHAIETGHIRPEALFVGSIEYGREDEEHYPFYVCGMTRLAVKGLIHEYLEDLP